MSFSLGFMSLITMPAKYFAKRRGLAVGLSGTGQGFGQAICNPLLQYLCNLLGWRMALKVMAAKMFLLVAFGAFTMRPATWVKPPVLPEGKKKPRLLDCSFFKDPAFFTVYMVFVFCGLGFFTPIAHLVRYAMDQGLTEQQAASLMVAVGACNVVGRVLGGKMSDSCGTVRTFAFCMCMTGLSTTLLPFSDSYLMMLSYAICYGLFGGSFMALNVVIYAEFFGLANLPRVMGLGTTSWLWGASVGPPLAGMIFDATGSYTPAWLLCGAALLLGGTIAACLPMVDRMYPNRCKRPQETSSPADQRTGGPRDLEAGGPRDDAATVEDDAAVAAAAPSPPVPKRSSSQMEILDSIVPASSEDGCRTSTAGGPTEGGWSSFGPAEQVKLSEKPPELVAQKDETETGTVVKVDSGTALALAAQVAALEAKLQASEDEKQAMALQLARFETRLMASEEERKATELAEKR